MKVLSLFDGKYIVRSDGSILSNVGRQKKLVGKITKCGYRMVVLNVNKKKIYPLVHRLVAKAFIPNPKNLQEVNHKDGNKDNNCVENLECVSRRQNQIHCRDSLKPAYSKINIEIARKIRAEQGMSHKELSKKYGLKKTEIGYILQNKRWAE